MVKGAMRSMEPWRNRERANESLEEKLDRLEMEEAEAAGEEERNAMEDLEAKNADARLEMAAADALDEIRQRNARIHRSEKEGTDFSDVIVRSEDQERERQEREDDEAAKQAFANAKWRPSAQHNHADDELSGGAQSNGSVTSDSNDSAVCTKSADAIAMPPPTFKRVVKKKKDHSALLGIKKKPSLV